MRNCKKRSYTIDLLRSIGILLVILAHINPPGFIFDIRSFDVVLLVIISSISVVIINHQDSPRSVIKRLFKIIIPTWIFIVIVFCLDLVLSKILHTGSIFTVKSLLMGLATFSGIGYLWIMRVFCYNAVTNPLIKKYTKLKIWWFYLIIAGIFGVYYLLYRLFLPLSVYTYLESSILHFIIYGLIAAVGTRLFLAGKIHLYIVTAICAVFCIVFAIATGSFYFQNYKYPPMIPFIAYGLAVCGLLFICSRINFLRRLPKLKLVTFISKNSLMIYFVHIIILLFDGAYFHIMDNSFTGSWLVYYFAILLVSAGVSYLISLLKNSIKNIKNKKECKNA